MKFGIMREMSQIMNLALPSQQSKAASSLQSQRFGNFSMKLSVIDPTQDQVTIDYQQLIETRSIEQLNSQLNQLVLEGWELRSLKRIELSGNVHAWHALLKKDSSED